MRTFELQPITENLLNTYCKNTIDRNEALHHFIDLLNAIDDCCVIAVDGSWGSGKTFFIKQAQMILDAYNPTSKIETSNKEKIIETSSSFFTKECTLLPQVTVYYDAWEYDNDDDPLLSLMYEIWQNFEAEYSFKTDPSALGMLKSIANCITERNISEVINALKGGEDPFSQTKSNRSIRTMVNDFLKSVLPERGERLVIFIDELDRCNPSYAVKLLERVKHYFQNKNITFVLSVNSCELQNTIKKYYGTDFGACKYLDKFFDLRIALPQANIEKYFASISFDSGKYVFNIIANTVIKKFNLQLREIAKYVRLMQIAGISEKNFDRQFGSAFSDRSGKNFCLYYIAPVMIGLILHDTNQYQNFISGKDPTPLIDVLTSPDAELHGYKELLDDNETYEIAIDAHSKNVSLESKIKAMYNAVFVKTYTNQDYRTKIGKVTFDAHCKEDLLRLVSMLSSFSVVED